MNKTQYISKLFKATKKAGHAEIRKIFAFPTEPTKTEALALKDFRRKGETIEDFVSLVFAARVEARKMQHVAPTRYGRRNFVPSGKMDFPCLNYRQLQVAQGKSVQARWATQLTKFDPGSDIYSLLAASHTDTNKTVWQNKKENCLVLITAKAEKYARSCRYTKWVYSYLVQPHVNLRKAPDWVLKNAGMIALWAEKEFEGNGEECWAVRWVRKGQGISLITEDGFILKRGTETAHGKTIGACRGVLKRRETENTLDEKERHLQQMLRDNNANGYADISVRVADSIKAGNCEAGTLAFRDRFFPGRDSATVGEILEAARTFSDRERCLAACARAIRSNKKVKEMA